MHCLLHYFCLFSKTWEVFVGVLNHLTNIALGGWARRQEGRGGGTVLHRITEQETAAAALGSSNSSSLSNRIELTWLDKVLYEQK